MKKIILAFLLLSITVSFAQEIYMSILTEDFSPLNYLENDELKGPAVDIVNLIREELKIKDEIKVYPWKRAYKLAKIKENVCLFSMTRTEQRENKFKWVGPLAVKRLVFLAKKSSGIKINNLEEAKKYTVGGQLAGAAEEFLRANNFENIDLAVSPEQNFKKLSLDRLDLWYTSISTPYSLADEVKVNMDDFEIVYVVRTLELYIAFSKVSSDDIVKKWQDAYEKIYREKKVEKIYEKYNLKSLYPEF